MFDPHRAADSCQIITYLMITLSSISATASQVSCDHRALGSNPQVSVVENLPESFSLMCETPGAQIIPGSNHMRGLKHKDGNNNVGLEPASAAGEPLDGCLHYSPE